MSGVMMQFIGGFGGFSFGDLLNQLDQMDFFRLVLPFLLIFALVYAILSTIKLFESNKGAAVIIALAVGLLALQLEAVPAFFQAIFPNLGIALSIMLAGLILAGAFIGEEKSFKWIFFGLGAVVFLVVVLTSLSSFQFAGSFEWRGWWADFGGIIMFLIIVGGVITAVVLANKR